MLLSKSWQEKEKNEKMMKKIPKMNLTNKFNH